MADEMTFKRVSYNDSGVAKVESVKAPPPKPEAATEDLNDLHVDELKDRARDAGVTGFSTMTKDELIKTLKKQAK